MRIASRTTVPAALAMVATLAAAPEHVRIAAVVTDRQGRAVPGLTLKDFELRVDGVVQTIESVEPRREAPRRIAILLDEFHVDASDTARVRAAVSTFVSTRLRPDDELIVLKPLDPLMAIRSTADRDAAQKAIASFDGRNGQYEPRSALEEETMGRAPGLVEASRAQVVLSALRALTSRLGAASAHSAILLVSNGFDQKTHRLNISGLPDVGIVERSANRYDLPIYEFDPRLSPSPADVDGGTAIDALVAETGGTVFRGSDLSASLARAAVELDTGYTLTYTPAHGEDGKFHPIQVSLARTVLAKAGGADARSRAGYISALPPDMRITSRTDHGPILSTRLLHRSPLIDVWSGITHIDANYGHVAVTWQPAANSSATAQIALKASTVDGKLLFEGFLAPVQVGEPPNPVNPDRVEFVAPPGRVQIDMTLINSRGQKLDVDARDLEVPAPAPTPLILPPIIIGTRTAREFRAVAADSNAAPDPARQFRRTDRLVIRVPAYMAGKPVPVTARLLNRIGQVMRVIDVLPDTAAGGVTQFDLPLASFAPGDYFLQFTVTGPSGPIDQRVPFKVTG